MDRRDAVLISGALRFYVEVNDELDRVYGMSARFEYAYSTIAEGYAKGESVMRVAHRIAMHLRGGR